MGKILKAKIKICNHHWILESPNGKYAKGFCKKCKTKREDFLNGWNRLF